MSSFDGDVEDEEHETEREATEEAGMQPWQSTPLLAPARSSSPQVAEAKVDDESFQADSEEEEEERGEDFEPEKEDGDDANDSSWSEDDDEGRRETRKVRPTLTRKRGVPSIARGTMLKRFDETLIEEITNEEMSSSNLPPWSYLIVGDIKNRRTWHLPVRDADGRISRKLLTKVRQTLQRGVVSASTSSKAPSIMTTRQVRMRVRRLSRHVWPGLPALDVHSSMKLDATEDASERQLKSELFYLQQTYKLANPDHDDDEAARRVEHTLVREEAALLRS